MTSDIGNRGETTGEAREPEGTAQLVRAICDGCDRAFGVMIETVLFAKCHVCGSPARYGGPGCRSWNTAE